MRKHYISTNHRTPPRAANSSLIQRHGGRFSLLAIQEEVQLPTLQGRVGARRLKILRIEQSEVLPDQFAAPRFQLRERYIEPPMLEAKPPLELPEPQLEAQELECWLEGKRVGLRGVGEVVT